MKDEHFTFLGKIYKVLFVVFIVGCVIYGIVKVTIRVESPIVYSILFVIAIFMTVLTGVAYFEKLRIWWKRPKGSRKGGVVKVIPDELAPKLEQLFQKSGIKATSVPSEFKGADEFKIPQFQLICSVPDSDEVVVYFIRYKHCLAKLIISLQPTVSKWWKLKADMKTLNRVCAVLEENGATSFTL